MRSLPRALRIGVQVVMLVVVAWVAYLAVTGLLAEHRLQAVRGGVTQLRADLVDPDATDGRLPGDVASVRSDAVAAAHDTGGPLWSLAARLPWLGRAPHAAQVSASVVRDLAVQVLPTVASVRSGLTSSSLHADHGIRLAPLQAAAPTLTTAAARTDVITARLDTLPRSTGVGPLSHGLEQLRTQLGQLSGELHTAADAAALAPPLLGDAGTRSYFVGFEDESESRGLGGLPGAYAILTADHGVLRFTKFGSDADLGMAHASAAVLHQLGAAYAQRYQSERPGQIFVNSDVSPDFPSAAKIWLSMWQDVTGQHLAGAIAVDPTALSALLAVTGPTALPDGEPLTATNVVSLTEQQAYARFPNSTTDVAARKDFLQDIAKASASQVVDVGPTHAVDLARAMASQAGQRRLQLYSTTPAQEATLAQFPLGGVLAPVTGADAVTGPYLAVAVENNAQNKVDYYLGRTVTWSSGGCAARSRRSTVTVTLTDGAPPTGLSAYAGGGPTQAAGLPGSAAPGSPPRGSDLLRVSAFLTAGAGITSATLDGRPAQLTSGLEAGRPVVDDEVQLTPGQTRTLVLHVLEPTVSGAPTTVVQPLVQPQRTSVSVPTCR